jgi:hypothetical protein
MTTLILSAAFLLGLGQAGALLFCIALAIKHMVHTAASRRDVRRRMEVL